ncbi:uncharacterized protein METZ01_LOCUS469424, partial [marine metagenome]
YSELGNDEEEKSKLTNLNEKLTERLATQCKKSKVKHFIYTSSISAGEKSGTSVVDENNGIPISPYGFSKLQTEELLTNISKDSFKITILRPTALFGENHKGSIYELTKRIFNKTFIIFGSGKNKTNFYYVRDFINLLEVIPGDERFYNKTFIASAEPCELNDLITWIYKSLKCTHTIFRVPLFLGYLLALIFEAFSIITSRPLSFSLRRMRAMTSDEICSNKKLKQIYSSTNDYGTEVGISRTVEWF